MQIKNLAEESKENEASLVAVVSTGPDPSADLGQDEKPGVVTPDASMSQLPNTSRSSGSSDSNEEKRVRPADKAKTPYTYAEFANYLMGDDKKSERLWNESG